MTLNALFAATETATVQSTPRALLLGEYGSRPWAMNDVTLGSINAVLKQMQPTLRIEIEDKPLELVFESINDFRPEHFTNLSDRFQELKTAMRALRRFASGEVDHLDHEALLKVRETETLTSDKDQVWLLYNELRDTLVRWVDLVLADASFQRLERNWLCLQQFLTALHNDQVEAQLRVPHCVVTLLNVSADEVRDDLTSVSTVADSQLFERIYSDELGQFGGQPYHAICPQFEFTDSDPDLETLTGLLGIAQASQCVVVAGVAQSFYQDPTLADEPLTQPRFVGWRHLVEQPMSRYLLMSSGQYRYRGSYQYEQMDLGVGYQERVALANWASLHIWHLYELAHSMLTVGTPLAMRSALDLRAQLVNNDDLGEDFVESSVSPERRHLLADLGINAHLASEHFIGFGARFQLSAALASIAPQSDLQPMDQFSELLYLQNQFARQLKMMVRETLGHSSPEAVQEFVRQWLQPFVQASGLVSRSQAQRQPLSDVNFRWLTDERGTKILSIQLKAKLAEYNEPVDFAIAWG